MDDDLFKHYKGRKSIIEINHGIKHRAQKTYASAKQFKGRGHRAIGIGIVKHRFRGIRYKEERQ